MSKDIKNPTTKAKRCKTEYKTKKNFPHKKTIKRNKNIKNDSIKQ